MKDQTAGVREQLSILMRSYFSGQHLRAALYFSREAARIEDAHEGRPTVDFVHVSYVTNSILSAFAFVEANINEVLKDAADRRAARLTSLSTKEMERLAILWDIGKRGMSTLDKYQTALVVLGHEPFDKGLAPYQDVELLRLLRNLLVHAEPETSEAGSKHKLEAKFGSKFPANAMIRGSKNPYFPSHCLGKGCAEWSAVSAINFADEFFRRINIEPIFRKIIQRDFGIE